MYREPTTAARPDPDNDPSQRPPPLNVRYFYTSLSSIDELLAPVPAPPASSATPPNLPPRAFSEYDSTRLDNAWSELRLKIVKYKEDQRIVDQRRGVEQKRLSRPSTPDSRRRHESPRPSSYARHALSESFKQSPLRKSASGAADWEIRSNAEDFGNNATDPSAESIPTRRRDSNSSQPQQSTAAASDLDVSAAEQEEGTDGLTHRPFIRAPSRTKIQQSWRTTHEDRSEDDGTGLEDADRVGSEQLTRSEPITKTPVGASRLHQVVMPTLTMEPIYWAPVHDVANVIRATWFYKDTMFPVEVDVANLLEAGFVTLRAWSPTWRDELNSAVDVGALGEMKIAHPLWPNNGQAKSDSRPSTSASVRARLQEEDTPEKRREEVIKSACRLVDSSTVWMPMLDSKAAGESTYGKDGRVRTYLDSAVIYANATDAYILRPSLQPSSYYGRRPLANYIKKGYNIGIRVVRGFDQTAWDRLHQAQPPTANDEHLPQAAAPGRGTVPATLNPFVQRRSEVTDLILVIHGIGQKLSERMESFHFTHAMNGFRRDMNVELQSAVVRPFLRSDMGGIMVLPCNWRSTLSFDEGGYRDGNQEQQASQFSMKDIMPETLPSVRSIISDVMLDIPYYMSHHQSRILASVTAEANRVYRLWCKHNPVFEKYGRVHLLAHSLGSVMAIDILSRQPTRVDTIPRRNKAADEHFEFDTTNLYLCGCPAGIFLLLKRAGLLPRRGRNKPSSDGEDLTPGVAGEAETYGCLAADNVYNVINPYDPVANRLNAAIDPVWAASLKPALVPSASASWYSFSNPFRAAPPSSKTASETAKRQEFANRLPSNVELETHNFTREELAEKRAYLLNDNGQIDYYLRYGGGALEIQYLTMLGAHSSYWTLRDFARFLVIETGRAAGKDGTLAAARAAKKKKTYAS